MTKKIKEDTGMKKFCFIVAVATLFSLSCQRENVPATQVNASFSFKATIEDLSTKANINASNQLVWTSEDKIGIYVNDNWDDKNQPFTLVGEGGSTTGLFNWDYGDFSNPNANVAFFPWHGQWKQEAQDVNNVNTYSESFRVYYKLPGEYGTDENPTYTSGMMVTPLAAKITRTGDAYDPIAFKHAGAAVKLTINNLTAGAHSIKMTANQQIYGYYHLDYNDIGEAAMVINDGAANNANNAIWLRFAASTEARDGFVFLFPVPSLAADADLSFEIFDKNDIKVWSRTATDQSAIGNAEVLVMPAITITPYTQFKSISTWYVHATLNGTDWADYPMVTDGSKSIAKGLSFTSSGQFKVTDGTNWYPSSNWEVKDGGSKDIIFDNSSHDIKVIPTGECPYPDVAGVGASGYTSKPGFDNSGWSIN